MANVGAKLAVPLPPALPQGLKKPAGEDRNREMDALPIDFRLWSLVLQGRKSRTVGEEILSQEFARRGTPPPRTIGPFTYRRGEYKRGSHF
jgi:hypothetical protein